MTESRRSTSTILGALALAGGLFFCLAAAAGWWHERVSMARPPTAQPSATASVPAPSGGAVPGPAAPDLAAAVVVRDEVVPGTFRPPTPQELVRARAAIAAELEAMAPGPVDRIPTTSGVGFTLGMHGASAAIVWPDADGRPTFHCHEMPTTADLSPAAEGR